MSLKKFVAGPQGYVDKLNPRHAAMLSGVHFTSITSPGCVL